MADWHRIKHKITGEEQTVAQLAGIDTDAWETLKLPREPKVDEDVVDAKIVKNSEKQKLAKGLSTIDGLTFDKLIALIDERITLKLGVNNG